MAEPATVALTNRLQGRNFTRSRLRDHMGPGNALYHLLETLCIEDMVVFKDEFDGVLNTNIWTASNSGGGTAVDFVRIANIANGHIQGDAGTVDNEDVRLFTTSNEIWRTGQRCSAKTRIRMPSAVANSKFEFGFADAAGAGAVLVKDTPTSTGTDYVVIVRDTDDDASVDMVSDGTTDAIQLVASSPGITFATNVWYDLLLATNENKESYFWIDGVYQGKAIRGPNITTALGLWYYVQDRDDANNRQLDVDYVLAWQERTALV